MGFVQKLRMNSLYPGGGVGATGARLDGPMNPYGGSITPPSMPPQIDFNQLLMRREAEDRDALNRETNVIQPRPQLPQIANNLAGVGNTSSPPQMTQPVMSQLDKWANEDRKNRALDITEKTAEGKIGLAGEGLDIKRGQLDINQQKVDNTKDLGEGKLDIEQSKLKLADWKAKNPNGKIVQVRGGNIHVIDPQSGEAIDTGVPSGTLSEGDKITKTGEQNRLTKTTIPGRAPVNSNADLPTQQKIGTQLSAQKLMNEHPEWAKFIKIDPNSGLVIVTPPGQSLMGYGPDTGPDLGTFSQINQALYPKKAEPVKPVEPPKVETKTAESSTAPIEKTQRNSAGQTRVVVSTDGGKTWVPKK